MTATAAGLMLAMCSGHFIGQKCKSDGALITVRCQELTTECIEKIDLKKSGKDKMEPFKCAWMGLNEAIAEVWAKKKGCD